MTRIGLEYIELSIYVQVRITLLCRVTEYGMYVCTRLFLQYNTKQQALLDFILYVTSVEGVTFSLTKLLTT